jgi:aconitate hydratase
VSCPRGAQRKDVILEMLRRHGVTGGRNRIIEYHGPGLEHLSAMDRHVIANMGATTTVFPADEAVRVFLRGEGGRRTSPKWWPTPTPTMTSPRTSTCLLWNR